MILPPLLIGAGVLVWTVARRRPPEAADVAEIARPLSVVTLQRHDVQPRVIAYGLARPARVWRAVAEVGGAVVETYPQLDAGIEVPQGTVLLTIDPTDFRLRVDRFRAEADAIRAERRELDQTQINQSELLKVEQESVAVATAELERLRELRQRNAASDSEVDQQRQQRLNAERSVQTIRNSLRLIPIQHERLDAALRGTNQQLELARRDLERTVIRVPFAGRLANVFIQQGQVIGAQQELFELHGTEVAEVEARIALDDLPSLLPSLAGMRESSGSQRTAEFEADTSGANGGADSENGSSGAVDRRSLADQLAGTHAVVRVRSGQWVWEMSGAVTRVRELVDARTRTLGVIVSVPQQSSHPPLLNDMFCEVELMGPIGRQQLVVPESALRGDHVYVVDTDQRLHRRRVTRGEKVPQGFVVVGALEAGERVVLTDPMPAVIGSLIEPIETDWPRRSGMQEQ